MALRFGSGAIQGVPCPPLCCRLLRWGFLREDVSPEMSSNLLLYKSVWKPDVLSSWELEGSPRFNQDIPHRPMPHGLSDWHRCGTASSTKEQINIRARLCLPLVVGYIGGLLRDPSAITGCSSADLGFRKVLEPGKNDEAGLTRRVPREQMPVLWVVEA